MTEHEDLIAEAHEEIETWDMDNGTLIPRLVKALEKVSAERDELSSLREQMSLRLRYVEGKREQAEAERDQWVADYKTWSEEEAPRWVAAKHERESELLERARRAEAERDALAAVVEQVRQWRHDWFNEPVEGVKRKPHHRRLDDVLDAAPSVALDRVKAKAVRAARDAIMPPVNCELRYDGTEDPGAAEYVGIMHEVHDRLSARADRIEKGKSND